MKKKDLLPKEKDDAVLLFRAIRKSKPGDSQAVPDDHPDRDSIWNRIVEFRGRFIASIISDTGDEQRRGVYLRILGKLYAAAMREYAPKTFASRGAEDIARGYADALLKSLGDEAPKRKSRTKADPCPHGKNKRTCVDCMPCLSLKTVTKAVTPSASTIREIPGDEIGSELLNTEWWPNKMYLMWIYAPRDASKEEFDLASLGSERKVFSLSRSRFIKRMGGFPVFEDTMSNAAYDGALEGLRSMINVPKPSRIPKTIVFDLRDDDKSTSDDVDPLRDATAKLGIWVSHLGTKKRPICVVVLSDEVGDAEHAAIAFDDLATSVPDVGAFIAKLALPRDWDHVNPKEEATLATALELAELPVGTPHAPVRWTDGHVAPRAFSLVSEGVPACSSVRYAAKNVRVFLAGDQSIVPHVRVTNETARLFIPFVSKGRADHASHVRVIDATALTMPSDASDADGKVTSVTKGHDRNVALLLAVAMDTPSVLIVTEAQSARMRLELGWMDKVFANGAPGAAGASGALRASSAAAGSQPPKRNTPSATRDTPRPSKSGSASAARSASSGHTEQAPTTVAVVVDEKTTESYDEAADHDEQQADATAGASAGAGKSGKDGSIHVRIFGEDLRVVKHAAGDAKCPGNMLRAADEHIKRLKAKNAEGTLEFLVIIGSGAAGSGSSAHHSTLDGNEKSIYLRCALNGADGDLELDYPDVEGRTVTSDTGKITRIVNAAMDATTKIFIVCTESDESAASVKRAKTLAADDSVDDAASQYWGYY